MSLSRIQYTANVTARVSTYDEFFNAFSRARARQSVPSGNVEKPKCKYAATQRHRLRRVGAVSLGLRFFRVQEWEEEGVFANCEKDCTPVLLLHVGQRERRVRALVNRFQRPSTARNGLLRRVR